MANRKNESAANFAPAIKALLLCAFFVTSGVGYVWYKSVNSKLGDEILRLEMRLADLRRANKTRLDDLAERSSPGELDTRAKKLNLGLGIPAVTQVVHLPEPAPVSPANNRASGTARAEGAEAAE